ncbi:hypothetical protein GCM10008943_27710 [Paenochrobactrum glaciei]|uniref:Uncharacterized protein n=1 Tax=Paenochrobactrum glaciei TaxID=486407 RepID=A0ABP3RN73_9HYPH
MGGTSITAKLLYFAHTLHEEVNKVHTDNDADLPSDMIVKMKALERVISDLHQTNEISHKVSVYFARSEHNYP